MEKKEETPAEFTALLQSFYYETKEHVILLKTLEELTDTLKIIEFVEREEVPKEKSYDYTLDYLQHHLKLIKNKNEKLKKILKHLEIIVFF